MYSILSGKKRMHFSVNLKLCMSKILLGVCVCACVCVCVCVVCVCVCVCVATCAREVAGRPPWGCRGTYPCGWASYFNGRWHKTVRSLSEAHSPVRRTLIPSSYPSPSFSRDAPTLYSRVPTPAGPGATLGPTDLNSRVSSSQSRTDLTLHRRSYFKTRKLTFVLCIPY